MWRSLAVFGVLGITFAACDGSSPGGSGSGNEQGGADGGGAAGEAGQGGTTGAGEGGSGASGRGGRPGRGGSAGRGGGDRGGEGGDAGASDDGGQAGGGESAGGSGGQVLGGNAGVSGGGAAGSGGIAGSGGVATAGAGMAGFSGGSGQGGAGTGGAGNGGSGGTSCADECLKDLGQSPCGPWSCSTTGECVVESATCVDRDGDGRGVGTTCTCALDCDDNDPEVASTKTIPCCRTGTGTKTCTNGVWEACTEGIPASAETCDGEDDDCNGVADDGMGTITCGMGACRTTVAACVEGELSACVPLEPAETSDKCNGEDDDCDGAVDEDCPSCVQVAPDGDDDDALASDGARPFRNLQPAIDFAASSTTAPKNVCVARGTTCAADRTYAGPATDLTMRNGVSLYANYEATHWTRCPPGGRTAITLQTGLGVLFPASVQSETILDGFDLVRAATSTTAAVTVDGAHGVVLSNLTARDGPVVTNSYGVNVVNGGEAMIFRSTIDGGRGTEEAIGVRAVVSRVNLQDNCSSFDEAGRCGESCSNVASGIRGRMSQSDRGTSFGVLLDDAAGSRIERSSVCADDAGMVFDVAALRIRGNATDVVVRANRIKTEAYTPDTTYDRSHGVWLDECEGATPRIMDNPELSVDGSGRDNVFSALRVTGACHPIIESNRIRATIDSGGLSVVGIRCGAHGATSRCVIARNEVSTSIWWTANNTPGGASRVSGTAVECTFGSCPRITRNSLDGLSCGMEFTCSLCWFAAVGLSLSGANEALIERNGVRAGGSSESATGMELSGVSATVQNNWVEGYRGLCGGATLRSITSVGLRISAETGPGEFDVHSNDISGGPYDTVTSTFNVGCTSSGVEFSGANLTGIFRDNTFSPGPCSGRPWSFSGYAFREAGASPRVLENNMFSDSWDPGDTYPVYLDGTGPLFIEQVNQLTDTISSGNTDGR